MDKLKRGGSYNYDETGQRDVFKCDCNLQGCGSDYFDYERFHVETVNNGFFKGVNTPNFHKLVREGALLPMTPFRKFASKGTSVGGYWLQTPAVNNEYQIQQSYDNWTPDTHWQLTHAIVEEYAPDPYDMYVQDAAAAMYMSGHDTLTFIAEVLKLKRMLFKVGWSLSRLVNGNQYRSLAKLLRREGKDIRKLSMRAIRRLSSNWLELRYGWRTLMFDIEDLNKAVKSCGEGMERKRSTRGRTYTKVETREFEDGNAAYDKFHTISDEITIGIRGSIVADFDVPEFSFNPIITGWEITYLSFVLDWVYDIGAALAAVSFAAQRPEYNASKGFKVEVTRTYSCECVGKNGYTTNSWQTGQCESVLNVREPCKVSYLPQLKLDLNAWKILDLLSLLAQIKGR